MSRVECAASVPARARRILFSALALDLVGVGLVAAAGAMLAARLAVAPLALTLIAAGLGLRVAQYRSRLRAIPLALPWLAFLLTTAVSANIAFDSLAAQQKFLLIVSGIALYFALATLKTTRAIRIVIWGLLLICAGAGLYFVTQTDFSAAPGKFALVNELGARAHALAPQFGWHTPHANLIAGILLLGLPYAVGECYNTARRKEWWSFIPSLLVTVCIAFALGMTTSRGAWLAALLFAFLSAAVYGAMRLARHFGYSTNVGVAMLLNATLLALLALGAFGGEWLSALLNSAFGAVSSVPRLTLYTQVYQLIQDYFWTGAGLETFSPNFSTYLLLIDVPFLAHSHNLFLQIWFEQGILALGAFVWLLVAYYLWILQRRKRMNWMALAGLAAVTMTLLHGLVDVPLYFSRVIPLMFVPFGLTVAALAPFKPLDARAALAARRMNRTVIAVAMILASAAFIFGIVKMNDLRASWEANRGALAQAQVELPPIKFSDAPPAQVRRAADLGNAIARYNAALELDTRNREARARLGIIALDREDFETAARELETAWQADPHQRATVKALGMAYVWTGKIDRAEPLLKQIPEAARELRLAQWKWEQRKRMDMAARAAAILERLE
ncbi:MAG: hypothetical protein BroJett039_06330 [Chloroflexota bacterium]|nr:MAG: hypothetical protein BroJett039_06330 [Chloroflexota bacterium]